MAQQTMTLACTKSAFIDSGTPNSNAHGSQYYNCFTFYNYYSEAYRFRELLLAFEEFPQALSKNIIYSAQLNVSANFDSSNMELWRYDYGTDFNENSVTYNNFSKDDFTEESLTEITTGLRRYSSAFSSVGASSILKKASFGLEGWDTGDRSSGTVNIYTRAAAAANRPTITVVYDDTEIVASKVVNNLPANGKKMDPTQAITFSWYLTGDPYYSLDPYVQESATFQWSSDGGSTWNSVEVSGSTNKAIIPANTFPGGVIQWKVTATDDRGATTTSETRTIDTTDTLATTTLISPIDTLEANDGEILFRWSSTNASGSTPTGYQFAWRDASVTPASWTQFKILGSTPEYRMPANTLPVGTIIWTVATYNRDDVMGSWSSQAQIRTVGAPAAPIVSATAVPFATIEWQATGQQAWRMTVDGKIYGPYFGGTKTFTLPDYLED
ncbi:MAG: hypothetical protein J6T26_07050, partial [Firmicutes bacterium]|nr:hypothetical protein [Bacillota bacterium]